MFGAFWRAYSALTTIINKYDDDCTLISLLKGVELSAIFYFSKILDKGSCF